MDRIIKFTEAIREATEQEMNRDSSVVVLGLGVDDERGLSGTTHGLVDIFGPERVFDTPLAEEGMTGIAVGMAMSGLRPIHTHARMDFLLLAMNQVINVASKCHYMYGGQTKVPLVIRVLIGDGWGAQHSQGLHSLFAHIPGLKVLAPSNPYDAKGCLISAIRDNNPVIFIEQFKCYSIEGIVPKDPYTVEIGKAKVCRHGTDVTLVSNSWYTNLCLQAANQVNISAEVIDLVSISPLDMPTIFDSVSKTGRLLVVDGAWTNCGITAEIIARVCEKFNGENIKVDRIGFRNTPCPNAQNLENYFYPSAESIERHLYSIIN